MKHLLSNRIVRQIGLSSLIKAAMAVLTLLLFFVLAKIMTVAEYGYFGFGFSLVQVLALVATGGLHVIIFRWVPEVRKQSGAHMAQAVVRQGLRMVVVLSLIVSAITLTLLLLSDPIHTGYAFVISSMVTAFAITEYLSSALRAQGSVADALMPRDIIWRGALALLFALAAIMGLEPAATIVLGVMSATLFGVFLYQLVIVLREQAASSPPKLEISTLLKQVFPIWVSSLINGTARNRDVIILGLLLDPTLVGGYFVASRVANTLNLASVAANSVSGNIIAEAYYEGKHGGLARNIKRITGLTGAITIAGALVILPLSNYILEMFGPNYISVRSSLIVLVLTGVVASCLGPVHYILSLTGKETLNLSIIFWGAAIALIAQVVLILLLGVLGAALGTACSVLAPRFYAYLMVRRHYHFDPSIIAVIKQIAQKVMRRGNQS